MKLIIIDTVPQGWGRGSETDQASPESFKAWNVCTHNSVTLLSFMLFTIYSSDGVL